MRAPQDRLATVLVVALLIVIGFFVYGMSSESASCKARGGVYVARIYTCMDPRMLK